MSQMKAQVDKLLTAVSNGLFPEGFIAEDVLPLVNVTQDTGKIGAYTNDHLRSVDDRTGGQQESRRVDTKNYQISVLYDLEKHALNDIVTEEDDSNIEEPFEAEKDTTTALTSMLQVNKEIALSSQIFSSSVITNGVALTSTARWDDYAASSPTTNIKDAQNAILTNSGVKCNAAVISRLVANTLSYHPAVLSQLGFNQERAGSLTDEDIKKVLKVKYLYIAEVPYNNSSLGQADVLAQIWAKSVLFYVRPDSAAKRQISLGYYLRKKGFDGRRVYKSMVDDPPGSRKIIVQDKYQFKIVNAAAGYLIRTVIS